MFQTQWHFWNRFSDHLAELREPRHRSQQKFLHFRSWTETEGHRSWARDHEGNGPFSDQRVGCHGFPSLHLRQLVVAFGFEYLTFDVSLVGS